jgi:hypothetical protein
MAGLDPAIHDELMQFETLMDHRNSGQPSCVTLTRKSDKSDLRCQARVTAEFGEALGSI